MDNCALDTFCGHDENSCKDFTTCHETQCHIQDMMAAELGSDWKEVLTGQSKEEEGDKPTAKIKLDENDARRTNFCGRDWADAASTCKTWCLGEDTDCPGSLKCFGDTSCYYDADLLPSVTPTISPSISPNTQAPVGKSDTRNNRKSYYAIVFWAYYYLHHNFLLLTNDIFL